MPVTGLAIHRVDRDLPLTVSLQCSARRPRPAVRHVTGARRTAQYPSDDNDIDIALSACRDPQAVRNETFGILSQPILMMMKLA